MFVFDVGDIAAMDYDTSVFRLLHRYFNNVSVIGDDFIVCANGSSANSTFIIANDYIIFDNMRYMYDMLLLKNAHTKDSHRIPYMEIVVKWELSDSDTIIKVWLP